MSNSAEFIVTVPPDNGYSNPRFVGRIAEHLAEFGVQASFVTDKNRIPLKDESQNFTLAVKGGGVSERIAAGTLVNHYGLGVSQALPQRGSMNRRAGFTP